MTSQLGTQYIDIRDVVDSIRGGGGGGSEIGGF